MGSWPFLIYMIDVLTTDGSYTGWAFLLGGLMAVYGIAWCVQRGIEEASSAPKGMKLFEGQNLKLNQDWKTYKMGDVITIVSVWNDGTVRVRYPDGTVSSSDLRRSAVIEVTHDSSKEATPAVVNDVTKGPRRIAVWFMSICVAGILYANFMPQKETAYKMLAAYVGQNVVESPRTQQLADSTIKYLDSQIKKYTEEMDKATKDTKEQK